jgi:L-alanine-DL-glutamate epimerase-like enolase superfamily enzyme
MDAPRRAAAGMLVVRGTPRLREAVHIRLYDDRGHVGLGEALPLPGYSRDDAAFAESVLAEIATQLAGLGLEVPDLVPGSPLRARDAGAAAARLDAALAPCAVQLAASPAARFALECALVDVLARRQGVSAAHWLADGRVLQPVPVSLLLPDDYHAALAAASAGVARGYAVLKLKIARADRTPAAEDALLAALRRAADAAGTRRGAHVLLRLDANGALDPARAGERMAALVCHGVELVEEPVSGAALLALPPLPLPWAADESLADAALAAALLDLPRTRRPAALVLKPAQLGLTTCLRLAAAAAARGVGVIVTHSLDGDLGHAAACALAAALPQPPWPCGLAPHAGLRLPLPALPWLPVPTALGLGVADIDVAA